MASKAPNHLKQGHEAERQACDYLQRQGLRLLDRNYRSPHGEIDLVMRHGPALVFIEVRYRKSSRYGLPQETVDARKQARIRATAEHYLLQTSRLSASPCRFDIVALSPGDRQITTGRDELALEWLQDAFGA